MDQKAPLDRDRRRPTRDDVARLAGTSTAVVSYVVNDGPRAVRPATRQKVLDAVQALGYQRNALAAALSGNASPLIGLIIPDGTNPFFSELRAALERAAFEAGHLLLAGSTAFNVPLERRYRDAFASLQVNRLLVVATGEELRDPFPKGTVFVHRGPAGSTASTVRADNYHAGYLATRHLLDEGHSLVHCLAADEDGPVLDRINGWRAAHDERGIEPPDWALRYCDYDRALAASTVATWVTEDSAITALLAITDEHGIGALAGLWRANRTVPTDCAVASIDGIHETETTSPPLTTVRMPLDDIARTALNALLHDTPIPTEPLPVALISRQSSEHSM